MIPAEPAVVFNGERQPADFLRGAYALRDLVQAVHSDLDSTFPALGDIEVAERWHNTANTLLATSPTTRAGVAAALVELLAFIYHWPRDLCRWQPMSRRPTHREVAGFAGWLEPVEGSLFFEIDGIAVSVDPDLRARAWIAVHRYDEIDVETVRRRGAPISRDAFDRLRILRDESRMVATAD
jgi:hypothetical protein